MRASTAEAASSKAASSIETAAKTHSGRISARANQALARVSTAIDGIGSTITEKSAAIRTSAVDYRTKAGKLLDGVSDSVKKATESVHVRAGTLARGPAIGSQQSSGRYGPCGAIAVRSVGSLSSKATAVADDVAETASKVATDMDRAHTAASRSVGSLSKSVTAIDTLQPRIARRRQGNVRVC